MTDNGRRAVALLLIVGLVGSVVIGGLATVFASSAPDGLEAVSEELGISEQEQESALTDSPFSNYETQGVEDENSSAAIALVVGIGATALIGFALFRVLSAGQRRDTDQVLPAETPDDAGHDLG